jgi:hypothetical protein
MGSSILLLSDLSYELGIIGLAELQERMEVARWLSPRGASKSDPRGSGGEERGLPAERRDSGDSAPSPGQAGGQGGLGEDEDPGWMKFVLLNRWHFTLGDVDCIPSVPHGHENAKTQAWPKLNPYTGRVFVDVHVEDVSRRLDRSEMQQIWRDDEFVERCRRQVLWYSERFPRYTYPNARRGKLNFPRW